jgi:SRSO17 transposase
VRGPGRQRDQRGLARYAAQSRARRGERPAVCAHGLGPINRERCRSAGIPADLEFATKSQLAAEIVRQLLAERCCPPWVTGDEVYGRDAKLRQALEDSHIGYVVKIPCSFRVTLPAGQKIRADHAARLVPAAAWQTASAGHGSKGERDYGWAWLATASARHHLLIRRRLTGPAGLAYFYCHVPAGRAC